MVATTMRSNFHDLRLSQAQENGSLAFGHRDRTLLPHLHPAPPASADGVLEQAQPDRGTMSRKVRPGGINSNDRVESNDATMSNTLMPTQELKRYDQCCGIHGAMRERKGAKKATSAARRRKDKRVIQEALSLTE